MRRDAPRRDGVQLRISIPRNQVACFAKTRAGMRPIVQRWMDTGKTPRGIRIKGTIWGKPSQRRHIVKACRGRAPRAGVLGVIDHYDRPNVTLCDYDTPKPPSLKRVWKVAQWLGLVPLAIEESRSSGGGWHQVITWDREMEPALRCALQMALGSDPARELHNLRRLLAGGGGSHSWNLLFQKKLV